MGASNSFMSQLNLQSRKRGRTDLIDASGKGDVRKVKELLADLDGKGLDVNYKDFYRYTALIRACQNDVDNRDIILALLSVNGIDVNVQSNHGYTALMCACWKGNREIVLALLSVVCVQVNSQTKPEGVTALMLACQNGNREVVSALLLVDDIKINGQNINKSTALMVACIRRFPEIALDLLLDRRVDRHILDHSGRNVLEIARQINLPTVVTRIEEMNRGEDRMPMLLVHHRYMYADPADTNNKLHPPASAIARTLVITGIVELICRYFA